MALYVISGKLGGGKTYYAIHWLVKTYCKLLGSGSWFVNFLIRVFLKDHLDSLGVGRYIIDPSKKVKIVTNIDGLKLPHESFEDLVKEAGGIEQFFINAGGLDADFKVNKEKVLFPGYNVIFIIDEAQRYFRYKHCKLSNLALFYFEYSRHLGHDIFLISQSPKSLLPELMRLVETFRVAQPRTLNVAHELTYRLYSGENGTDEIGVERVLKDKKIMRLYQSMTQKEAVKITNPLARKFFAALVICLLMLGWGGYGFYKSFFKREHPQKEQKVVSSQKSVSPQAPSAFSSGSSVNLTPQTSSFQQDVPQFYAYKLDFVAFAGVVRFRLGLAWVPREDFPYRIIKKGTDYFAIIPSALVPNLDNDNRSLPIIIKQKET